ncbi:DNA primase [Streptomyces chrestomyceticus JCM 4735]|uniref:DNA primase n=1 Tax=Streptomyces chrestomyceticus JCM 4735 TaxID=1306181 RepID=A0A7U9KWT2_9ACTN|nr:DNA primase [Streptomyces chrestomyceticus JCM 4735]
MASPHLTPTGSHPSHPDTRPDDLLGSHSVDRPDDHPGNHSVDRPEDRPGNHSGDHPARQPTQQPTRSTRSTRSTHRPARPTHRSDAHATALTHALVAAGRGYSVLPLTRAKLPAVRSPHHADPSPASTPCRGDCGRPGHGIHDATSDPLAVRHLFAAAPWATAYGIACGVPPHHLIGIDLDTKHGADGLTALRLLAAQHHFALPPTVTVRTPSGGRHLYFSGPPAPPVPNSAGRLAPGIDIRGTGGYLVGPGSRTSRGEYHLVPGTPRLPTAAPAPSSPSSHPSHRPTRTPTPSTTRPPRPPLPHTPIRPRPCSASSAPPRTASATPASSGPPAAPTNPASAKKWPPP